MEYPGYSKTLGYYTVKAKKITNAELPAAFYSLDDYKIQTQEDLKKQQQEHAEKISDLRMKNIGEKAVTFKDLTLKNEKIDTKKMLGEIIVYNFWFTTCGPCKAEMAAVDYARNLILDVPAEGPRTLFRMRPGAISNSPHRRSTLPAICEESGR